MSEVNFAMVVNLSNFFNDHRHRARLYINDRIKTILDLQNKISALFGIKNFFLTSQNEFLPPTEDVRILHKDDILWVIPSKETENPYDSFPKYKERKSSSTVLLDINESKKKKQKIAYSIEKPSKSEEIDEITSSGKRSKTKRSFEEEIQFNHKSKPQKSKKSDKNEFEETRPKKSKNLEEGPVIYETHKLNPEVEEYIQEKAKKKKKNKNEENQFSELHKYIERSKKRTETIEEKAKKNMDKKEEIQVPFSERHEHIQRSKKRTEPVEEKPKEILNKKEENQAPLSEFDQFKKNSDEAGQVVVGNGISSTVYIKRNTPVPTITDQYLKEKQINIVKIDYISKPISASEPNSISSPISNGKVTENAELISYIEEEKEGNGSGKGIKEINNEQVVSFPSNSAEVENNYQNFKESQTNSLDTEPSTEKQENFKNWKAYPRTKFFFMNTPSSKEKRENANQVIRPKKSNIFKLRDDLRLTRFIPKILVSQNEVVDVFIKNPESNLAVIQKETDAEEKKQVPKNVATTTTYPQNCNENVILTNGHSYDESSNIYDQRTEIIPSSSPEFVGIGSPGATLISNISPCLTNILDTPVDKDISGVEVLNAGKKSLRKQISGVGQFLDSIRKNRNSLVPENNESLKCLDNSSENVTMRKRHRVRKRKSKSGNKSLECVNPILSYPKPLKVEACPKLHIKFSDDEDESAKEISVVSIGSSEDDEKVGAMQLLEEDILKAPLMTDLTPNLNDIIVFKILKLSDNCSPEVSNYIMGHVRDFSSESKAVTFEITYGLDQLEGLEEMLCSNSKYHEFLWSDLLEPRLLYP